MDTTSGRSVIAGNRQTDSGTVTEVDRLLYKSLAERASSDNCSPIVVLNSSGEDLAGRSGTFVNEYDERHFLATACAVSKFFCTGIFTALRIYYQFSFRQEFVYHADSCFHVSSGVTTQVDNQPLAFFMVQLCQCVEQLYMSGTSELAHFYVADIIVHHISGVYSILRNISTCDIEVQQVFFSHAFDS